MFSTNELSFSVSRKHVTITDYAIAHRWRRWLTCILIRLTLDQGKSHVTHSLQLAILPTLTLCWLVAGAAPVHRSPTALPTNSNSTSIHSRRQSVQSRPTSSPAGPRMNTSYYLLQLWRSRWSTPIWSGRGRAPCWRCCCSGSLEPGRPARSRDRRAVTRASL